MPVKSTSRGLFFFFLLISICSCEIDRFYQGDARLRFSVDTLFFDTVFTSVGSTTKSFKVYNPYFQDVWISSIRLAGPDHGFRLNIDGISSNNLQDVVIPAKDSLYIFVEVTIDPLGSDQPLLVKDSVVFTLPGNIQDIDLVAVGQDVHLVDGEVIQTMQWINDKPYLVYHSMLVDTNEVLTIYEGVKVYFHRGSTLFVTGTLRVLGTIDQPVCFLGDRLEKLYEDIPGQWGGIYFINGSTNNLMENVIIKNASAGVHLGNLFTSYAPPDLVLKNVEIQHMSYAGISSIGAKLLVENALIADCGFYNLILTAGGDYRFTHCTLANYWSYSNRITPAVVITNYFLAGNDVTVTGDLTRAEFGNCIITGKRESEFLTDRLPGPEVFNYYLDHCLLKIPADQSTIDPLHFGTLFKNEEPGFTSVAGHNYTLDTLAFAKDRGSAAIALTVPLDLYGHDRLADTGPDLGAIERLEKK